MPSEAAVGLAITFLLVILGLCFRQSRVLETIQLLWMWVISALNTNAIDWNVHLAIYEESTLHFSFAPSDLMNGGQLYGTFLAAFRTMGLSFVFANAVLSTVIIALLYRVIKRYTSSPCFALSLFILTPFLDGVIQKRFFLASVIVLWGLKFLYRDRPNLLLFCLTCLIAVQIHVMAIAYLTIALFFWLRNLLTTKATLIVLFAELISLPLLPRVVQKLIPSNKFNLYFVTLHASVDIFDFLFWASIYLLFVLVFFAARSRYLKWDIDNQSRDYLNYTAQLNAFFIVVIPFLYFEPTAQRYISYLLLMIYLGVAGFGYDFGAAQLGKKSTIYGHSQRLLVPRPAVGEVWRRSAIARRKKLDLTLIATALCSLVLVRFLLMFVFATGNHTTATLLYPIFTQNLFLDALGL